MATIKFQYSCGCGYKSNNLVEAEKHADDKKHTLSVIGTIQPVKEKA